MKHAVSDSSSLILLAKAGILTDFLERREVWISPVVEKETIGKGKEKGREDAYLLEKLKEEDEIEVKDPDEKEVDRINRLFDLHKGEKEVVALASELGLPLICDDKKAFNACEVMEIEQTTALNILSALFEKGRINKSKARRSLKKLEEFGWYEEGLIQHVKSKIGD